MQIPIQQVLNKIETELHLAKETNNDVILREKLAIIKAMCEVALSNPSNQQQPLKTQFTSFQPMEINNEEEETPAPSGSLLDF